MVNKILVTGAAGFIGSHLCDALLSSGAHVVGMDDMVSGAKQNIPRHSRFSFISGDIRKEKDVLRAAKGASSVFHFAADPFVMESAERPRESFEVNAEGTLNVLQAARKTGVSHMVFASSSVVYGERAPFPTPETFNSDPVSNYGASKVAGEAYLASFCRTYGFKGTSLRFGNIYGPRSVHGVMHDFYMKLRKDPKKMEILGDGRQSKSYLYIDDCISGILLAAEKQDSQYGVFNIASGEMTSVDEVARIACKLLKVSPKFTYTGGERGWKGDIPKSNLDITKISELGWRHRWGIEEGMASYLQWIASGNSRKK